MYHRYRHRPSCRERTCRPGRPCSARVSWSCSLPALYLSWQNHRLSERVVELERRVNWPVPGTLLPPGTFATLSADSVRIGAATDRRTVLFFLETTCEFCRQTLPRWEEIADQVRSERGNEVRVLGVSIDSTARTLAYARTNDLSFPVAVLPGDEWLALYRVAGVPLTVVIDTAGRVVHKRRGLISTRAAVDSVVTRALDDATTDRPDTVRAGARSPPSGSGGFAPGAGS